MNLNHEIIELVKQEGCNIVGFADLRCLSKEVRQNFDYGIIMGLSFTKEAMQENMNDKPQRYKQETDAMQLNKLAKLTYDFLIDKGYKALAKIPSTVVSDKDYRSILPHKTVATLAGIGWIGKNAMLVTNEAGSAVRFTVVLTNAPLECGTPVTKSKCSPNCTVCTDVCPGKAPLGRLWEVGVDRDEFFDAHACRSAAQARAKKLLGSEETQCGLCISNCPFTKKSLNYK